MASAQWGARRFHRSNKAQIRFSLGIRFIIVAIYLPQVTYRDSIDNRIQDGYNKRLIVEPDLGYQERFAAYLSDEADLVTFGIGTDLVSSCQSNYPPRPVDVLLINLDTPEMTRMASWALIHALLPGVWIVGLLNDADDLILKVALRAGVIGLHRLSISSSVLCKAIRRAAKGITDYDPELVDQVKKLLFQSKTEIEIQSAKPTVEPLLMEVIPIGMSICFTRRENHILALVSRGISNREIGDRLHLSEKTECNCMSGILSKLGLKNRTQATVWAWEILSSNDKSFT